MDADDIMRIWMLYIGQGDAILVQFPTDGTNPIELLVLSACESASGDDRAALGLAGVAIKAGANSALATLWQISDEATSELIAHFYRQLHDTSFTKAKALQQAQLELMSDARYEHPLFWSPFILINNWL